MSRARQRLGRLEQQRAVDPSSCPSCQGRYWVSSWQLLEDGTEARRWCECPEDGPCRQAETGRGRVLGDCRREPDPEPCPICGGPLQIQVVDVPMSELGR